MGAVAVAAQVVVVVVLVAAGVGKLRAPDWTARTGLPGGRPLALGLPVAELAVAVLVLTPATARIGLALAAGLFAVLAAGVAALARRGTGASCACFGRGDDEPLGTTHVLRNLTLTLIAAVGALAAGTIPDAAALAVGVGYGVPLALLALSWSELTALTRGELTWRT